MQLQPSELMKILLVIALAAWFHRASLERVGNPLFLLPPLLAVLLPVGLILRQPNLGTGLIVLALGGIMFFAAGVRLWKFALAGIAVVVAAPIAYEHLHAYQRARIITFLDPESDPLGAGYNIIQSKIALGSGGVWGKGFLQGTQGHLNFLPEKQTDFIFTMWAEEFGFVGAISLLTLLAGVILFGFLVALHVSPSVWTVGGDRPFLQPVSVCVRECGDGDGHHPGGRRAVADDQPRRIGDADGDAGLRRAAVGASASRRRSWCGPGLIPFVFVSEGSPRLPVEGGREAGGGVDKRQPAG